MLRAALAFAFAFGLVPTLGARAAPTVRPARVATSPQVDGRLDDAVWQEAQPFEGFVQKSPDPGARPSDRTSLRVLYNAKALYIGVDCEQRAAPLVARLTRRDRVVEADRVEVAIDTALDRRSAFRFEVSAAGVKADAVVFDDIETSYDWDDLWEAEVARRAGGWSAELRIPLRILRIEEGPEQTWGFQVRRFIAARHETDELSYIARDQAGEVSRFAQLGPIAAVRRPFGLELVPFATAQLTHRDRSRESLAAGYDSSGDVGLDGRWRFSRPLTLAFTVRPDFGQVEADQVVLNLTSYETLLPEKRPFFLEGMDLFSTPINLLYTRRIGAAPSAPPLAEGDALVAPLGPVPIDAAAKLSGRATRRVNVAALAALTGPRDAVVRTVAGNEQLTLVAPRTLYGFSRVRADLGRTAVGAEVGAVNRLEARESFRDTAFAGADLTWRSRSGDVTASGQVVTMAVRGGMPVVLPDGNLIAPGDDSAAARAVLAKPGGRVIADLECEGFGRDFDPNDLAFIERSNLVHCFASAGLHGTQRGRFLLEHESNMEVFYRGNLDGQHLASGYQLNTAGDLTSFWHYFTEIHLRPAHLDDRELGDGTALERAGLWGLELSLSSDPRRFAAFSFSSTSQILSNGVNFDASGSLVLNLLPQLDLEILPDAVYTSGEPRYVGDAPDGRHLFGRQRALALGATVRATYTFRPNLSLQAYAQIFADRVTYRGFLSSTPGDRTIELDELEPAAPPAESPAFADGTFNASVLLRWEWRLGSVLYLVYSRVQNRTGAPGTHVAGPAAETFSAPASDTILAKLAIWFGT